MIGGCSDSDDAEEAAAARAVDHLEMIVADDFAAVEEAFDETVAAQMGEGGLSTAWQQCRDEFGEYVDHGDPRVDEVEGRTVVRIALEMSEADAEIRVSYDDDERVAGIFFLRPGVPLP